MKQLIKSQGGNKHGLKRKQYALNEIKRECIEYLERVDNKCLLQKDKIVTMCIF